RIDVPLPSLPPFLAPHVILSPPPTSQNAILTSSSQGVSPLLVEESTGYVGVSFSPSSVDVTGALESIAPFLRESSSSWFV
ncbi:unnamed protein product, partial [Ilex paraguariensis]